MMVEGGRGSAFCWSLTMVFSPNLQAFHVLLDCLVIFSKLFGPVLKHSLEIMGSTEMGGCSNQGKEGGEKKLHGSTVVE